MRRDNQSLQNPDDEDETSDALVRDFSHQNDQDLEEEHKQVTKTQGSPPRELKHENFHFNYMDIKTVTAGQTNDWYNHMECKGDKHLESYENNQNT